MPLPNDNQSEAATPERRFDPLDDLFQSHVETCDCCQLATRDMPAEPGVASRRILSLSATIELLDEPEFQEAVATIQDISVGDVTVAVPSSRLLEVGSQIGSYRLLAPIACGGMGQVYRALHVGLDKVVAVKLMAPDRVESASAVNRFQREMKALGQFSHPHVVTATDGGEDNGRFFLAMELVEGLDLSSLVDRLGPLGVADAAELIRQAALGLQAIHRQGLVHRDIKPSNLMLSREGVVKVLDLGLSKFAEAQDDADNLTETGRILGTKRYMAPEQFESSQVDKRADLYSLGVSLATLLSGRHPAVSSMFGLPGNTTSYRERAAGRPPLQRDDIPPELTGILTRFTAWAASDRPASAGILADALQPHCAGSNLKDLLLRGINLVEDPAIMGELPANLAPSTTAQRLRSTRRLTRASLLAVMSILGISLAFAAFHETAIPDPLPNNPAATNPDAESIAKDSNPPNPMSQMPIERQQECDVARWVLMKRGEVVRHPHSQIRHPDEIPKDGPFRVRSISLVDRGLANVDLLPLQRLSMLDSLNLSNNSSLTNRGLTEVARIRTLRWIYFGGTQINDDALPSLNNLVELESLGLGATAVSDNGLATLVRLNGLRELQLNKTQVTDEGLAHLKNFPILLRLDLTATGITDRGLEQIVESAVQIKYLRLRLTKITGDGISPLKKLRELKDLNIEQTAISPQQVETLRRALPSCNIKH